ncbi:hypothetical protein ES705_41445 [subsurface metagenome]
MEETVRHIEIFNLYYAMGDDRSIKKLWNKLNQDDTKMIPKVPSYQTLKRWSKTFSWQERIKQTDIEVSEILKKKLKETAVYSKESYRKLIKEVIDKFKEKLEEGKIKISKPQDIIEMIKLDLLVMGEPTGREEHLVTHKLIEVDIGKYPKQNEENNISG